ncbi:methyltransferase family protein [Nonlabens dokdonensis]|uniref:Methyltransferase type 12 n=2 Tax=Nonlabens dokdonensis TaxID=328515 RepID=L7W417_NONDD|nr:methyltransferase domain-containing protein [Nonlabens dokdonensis]AGC76310.1 methyltransferase type 12 [Nonlabens dokdonensis DSW-6]PZX43972.1 methyltransferase family protein [Nonlabens dokdonensis]
MIFSTEVASSQHKTDQPILNRCLAAYVALQDYHLGSTLEIGVGSGDGIKFYIDQTSSLTVVDKNLHLFNKNKSLNNFDAIKQVKAFLPDQKLSTSVKYDTILCFQFLEHIERDFELIKHLFDLLNDNGALFLTTPNKEESSGVNPWHYREYNQDDLQSLFKGVFKNIQFKGVFANEASYNYHLRSLKMSNKIKNTFLIKQYLKLPKFIQHFGYEWANRYNRIRISKKEKYVSKTEDYKIDHIQSSAGLLDFFVIAKK